MPISSKELDARRLRPHFVLNDAVGTACLSRRRVVVCFPVAALGELEEVAAMMNQSPHPADAPSTAPRSTLPIPTGQRRPAQRRCAVVGMSLLVVVAVLSAGGLLQVFTADLKSAGRTEPGDSGRLSVAEFLPAGYVMDGSVSYQAELQAAIDAAAEQRRTLVFPPMIYRIDESGLRLRSHSILRMQGAVFRLDEHRSRDGQAFLGRDVANVRLLGGEIVGESEAWPEGVNIRGIHLTGRSRDVGIGDMHIHGLSSNGIGVFGDPEHPARDVWITNTVIEDCCNRYGDYQSDDPGPEKGSVREDQGLIAFYHVRDFVVRGCRLEKSRSDGTHFYRCRQGQFVQNKVYGARMGGYFLETCHDVAASDNLIRDNGSRGVTIERGSRNCTLRGNVVANSGREGLWAPDSTGLVVTGNIFDRNGRKPNGDKPHTIWNANITINEAHGDPTNSPTEDYLISDNIVYTTASQVAAIRIDAGKAKGVVVKDNLLRGENRRIVVEGDQEGRIVVEGNN